MAFGPPNGQLYQADPCGSKQCRWGTRYESLGKELATVEDGET